MGILNNLTEDIKNAMRAKDSMKLEALRAIKSAVLLAQTAGGNSGELSDDEAIKLLQRLVKQRRDSAAIFNEQKRPDLAEPEEAQAVIIMAYLPEQLSEEAVAKIIDEIIAKTGAASMKDMGKVMGILKSKHADSLDFSKVSLIIKEILN